LCDDTYVTGDLQSLHETGPGSPLTSGGPGLCRIWRVTHRREAAITAKDFADLAIAEDPFAPCLWIPSEWWGQFLAETDRKPNAIGAVIYRNKTVRDGGPGTDFQTGSDQGGYRRR